MIARLVLEVIVHSVTLRLYCIPVHGGWSSWNALGGCSVTCGVGLHNRRRTCDNPVPSFGGDHCFGDTTEYEVCYTKACNGKL